MVSNQLGLWMCRVYLVVTRASHMLCAFGRLARVLQYMVASLLVFVFNEAPCIKHGVCSCEKLSAADCSGMFLG